MGFQSRRTKDRVSYAGDENSRARYFQDHDAITNLLESAAFRDKLLNRKRDESGGKGDEATVMRNLLGRVGR